MLDQTFVLADTGIIFCESWLVSHYYQGFFIPGLYNIQMCVLFYLFMDLTGFHGYNMKSTELVNQICILIFYVTLDQTFVLAATGIIFCESWLISPYYRELFILGLYDTKECAIFGWIFN